MIGQSGTSPFMESMPRLRSHHPSYHTFNLAHYTTITTINTPPSPSSGNHCPYTTRPLSSMFWDKVSVDKRPVHPHPNRPQFKKLGCETNVNPCMLPQALHHYKVKGVCARASCWVTLTKEVPASNSPEADNQGHLTCSKAPPKGQVMMRGVFSLPEDKLEEAPGPGNGWCSLLSAVEVHDNRKSQ